MTNAISVVVIFPGYADASTISTSSPGTVSNTSTTKLMRRSIQPP